MGPNPDGVAFDPTNGDLYLSGDGEKFSLWSRNAATLTNYILGSTGADTGMGFGPTFRFGNPFFLQPGIDELLWRTQIKDNFTIVSGRFRPFPNPQPSPCLVLADWRWATRERGSFAHPSINGGDKRDLTDC